MRNNGFESAILLEVQTHQSVKLIYKEKTAGPNGTWMFNDWMSGFSAWTFLRQCGCGCSERKDQF